jgi:hypothetical protein
VLAHGQPLACMAHSVNARYLHGDKAALLVHCKPVAALRALGIDAVSEAARLRSGEGLVVTVLRPGGPKKERLPVRAVPVQRPPRRATIKILRMESTYAVCGLTRMLLECAGYGGPGTVMPRVECEFMAQWGSGCPIGRADVIIAYVTCPVDDPELRRLPREFSMGAQRAKIEVLPSLEPLDERDLAGAEGPALGHHPVRDADRGRVPEGFGGGDGQGGRSPAARAPFANGEPVQAAHGAPHAAGEPPDPRGVADPAGGPGRVGVGSQSGRAASDDFPMTDEEGEAAGLPEGYMLWRTTAAAMAWDLAITNVTSGGDRGSDEVPGEGVDEVQVMIDFYIRFNGDPAVDIGASPAAAPGGEGFWVPRAVRQWLTEAQYRSGAYEELGPVTSSDEDMGVESSEEAEPAGAQVGRRRQSRQQQQQPQQQPSRPPSRGAGVRGGPRSGQGVPGQSLGVRRAPSPGQGGRRAGSPTGPRRSTRERRQALLASELPESLVAHTHASVCASGTASASHRPPHPIARGVRRPA